MGALLGLVSAQNIHFAITVFTREATFHHESKKSMTKFYMISWQCGVASWKFG